jgi:hypothetical protein
MKKRMLHGFEPFKKFYNQNQEHQDCVPVHPDVAKSKEQALRMTTTPTNRRDQLCMVN